MGKNLIIPTIFSAIDKLSAPVRAMSRSVSDFANRTEAALARSDRRFRSLSRSAISVGKKAALIGTMAAAPLVLAGREAVKFEDKMADVAKVAGFSIGDSDFVAASKQAKDLGIYLGIGATSAADLMQNLAQGGVAIADLDNVSRIAGKVGVAFGMAGAAAGEAFIKTKNALGGTIEETEKLMDTINYLGNTVAASSEQILTFMSTGGSSVARAAGASGAAVSAMGAQLISMGKSAEESATIMERFTKATLMTKSLRKVFDAAGGGAAGMMAVIQKGALLTGKKQDKYFQQFGQYGLAIQLMAKNYGELEKIVGNATNAQLVQNSVLQEFENRTKTTQFALGAAKARVEVLAIELGTHLLPVVIQLLEPIISVVTQMTKWMQANPALTKTLIGVALGGAALSYAISGISFAVGGYAKVMLLFNNVTRAYQFLQKKNIIGLAASKAAFGKTTVAIRIATAAQWLFNTAMGAMTLGLSAIAIGLYAVVRAMNRKTTAEQVNADVQRMVIEQTAQQQVEIEKLFRVLRTAEQGSKLYNDSLKALDKIMPGIVEKYNLATKSVENFGKAQMEMIKTVREAARKAAVEELYSEAVKETLLAQQNLREELESSFGFWGAIADKIKNLGGGGVAGANIDLKNAQAREQELLKQVISGEETKPVVGASEKNNEPNPFRLDIFNHAPGFNMVPSAPNIRVQTGSTRG